MVSQLFINLKGLDLIEDNSPSVSSAFQGAFLFASPCSKLWNPFLSPEGSLRKDLGEEAKGNTNPEKQPWNLNLAMVLGDSRDSRGGGQRVCLIVYLFSPEDWSSLRKDGTVCPLVLMIDQEIGSLVIADFKTSENIALPLLSSISWCPLPLLTSSDMWFFFLAYDLKRTTWTLIGCLKIGLEISVIHPALIHTLQNYDMVRVPSKHQTKSLPRNNKAYNL